MRLLLFGSGAFGIPTFEALGEQHEVVALVGPPDRPAGRKRVLTPAPAVQWALDAGVEAWRSENVNVPAFRERVVAAAPEASVVIAFGQKLGPALLQGMGRLSVNLHGSLLPAWRGAAPVQRSVMAGEAVTGVSVIGLAERMDAGSVYARASLPVRSSETAGDVHDRLAALGPEAVLRVLADLEADRLAPEAQDEGAVTHAAKLTKADGTASFDEAAAAVAARINGLNPWPGCRVRVIAPEGEDAGELLLRRAELAPPDTAEPDRGTLPPGTVLDGARVATAGGGVVRLLEAQAPGRGVVAASDHAHGRGAALRPGARLAALPRQARPPA